MMVSAILFLPLLFSAGNWESMGPDQGVVDLACLSQEPFELYLCLENGHILYSFDAGETLELFASYDYEAIAINPFNDQEVVSHCPT